MCGIAGFQGDFEPHLLHDMNEILAHRGPDASGVSHQREWNVGLAHRRLSILDLSPAGHQPMWDSTSSVGIVYNGETYNFLDLRAELMAQGVSFKSNTDTEVLLHLYLRDGVEMVQRIDGIFAFAIYDGRDGSLFLARDGAGIKPLYYVETPRGFLFASEIKALLAEPSVPKDIDAHAICYYLRYLWCPAPKTILKAVKKLEPGVAMIVRGNRIVKMWSFYDYPYVGHTEDVSEQDAIAGVQSYLEASVRKQMIADVPVGAFLSGGLDSGFIASLAKKYSPDRRLQCFTINAPGMEEEGFSADLPFAKKLAQHLDVDLCVIDVDHDMVDQLPDMIYHLDEPQADPAAINVYYISQLARANNIKVLLSGAGGDDIFTGYSRHYALKMEHLWSWMPLKIRRMMRSFARIGLMTTSPFGRRLAKGLLYADLEGDHRIASYFYWIAPSIQATLYGPAIRDELQRNSDHDPLVESLGGLDPAVEPMNRMLYLDAKYFLADHNLNYTDKMSMATGVEVRVPFLDADLVALAARLPTKFKQRGPEGKWILKKAAEPFLPKEVIYRPKTGFGAPLRRWIRNELQPIIEDYLGTDSLKSRGLFDPQGVRNLIEMNRVGKIDAAYSIFAMICIEQWCRLFIER